MDNGALHHEHSSYKSKKRGSLVEGDEHDNDQHCSLWGTFYVTWKGSDEVNNYEHLYKIDICFDSCNCNFIVYAT